MTSPTTPASPLRRTGKPDSGQRRRITDAEPPFAPASLAHKKSAGNCEHNRTADAASPTSAAGPTIINALEAEIKEAHRLDDKFPAWDYADTAYINAMYQKALHKLRKLTFPSPVARGEEAESAACESALGYPSTVHSQPCSWPACELTCRGRKHRLSAAVAIKALRPPSPPAVVHNSTLPTNVTKAGLSAYTRNRDGLNVHPEERHHLMSDAYWAMHNMMIPQQVAEPPATVDDDLEDSFASRIFEICNRLGKIEPGTTHERIVRELQKLRQRAGSGVTREIVCVLRAEPHSTGPCKDPECLLK